MSVALHRLLLLLTLCAPTVWAQPCDVAGKAALGPWLERLDALALQGQLAGAEALACVEGAGLLADSMPAVSAVNVRAARRLLDLGKKEEAAARLDARLPEGADTALRIDWTLARAELATASSRLAEAEELVREASALLSVLAVPDSTRELRVRYALAQALWLQRKAEPARQEAAALLEFAGTRFSRDGNEMALAQLAVASAARIRGDHGATLDAIERILGIDDALGMQANPRVHARALVMLAQTRKLTGDFERAGRDYEVALDWLRRHPEPTPLQLGAALHGIANLHRDSGQLARSLEEYTEALPLFEAAYGEVSVQHAQVLNNYGNALGMTERYDEARHAYDRAWRIAEALGMQHDPALMQPLLNQSLVLLWQRDFRGAEAGFRRNLPLLQAQSAASETTDAVLRLGLAASLWGLGHHAEAFAEAERAELQRQLAVAATGAKLSEASTLSFQEVLRPSLDLVNAIALDSGDSKLIARAWELGMAARGQVTQQTAARLAAGRNARDPGARKLFDRWRDTSTHVAELRLAALSGQGDAKALRDAQAALERDERALGRSVDVAALRSPPTLGRVRAALPTRAWLASFSSGNVRLPEEFALLRTQSRPRDLYAFIAAPTGEVRLQRIEDEAAISRDITHWRELAGRPDSDVVVLDEQGAALRRRLLDPLRLPLADTTVLVVPTGELARLNFAALPLASGKYGVEAGVRYFALNHESELLVPRAAAVDAPRVLALSDPLLPVNAATCGGNMPGLPGTRREVAALRAMLPAHAILTDLHGEAAREMAVRAALPAHEVLHLATHALDLDTRCANGTRGAGFAFREAPTDGDVPRIGALLTGADPGDDGLLTEAEIQTLDLSATRWAVLSACSTALGSSRAYEGAFGLRRAFALAGVRSVIMSLWRIDDDASVEWMAELYHARWHDGADSIAALHSAMSKTIAARRAAGKSVHPYYWAGFVGAGDWR